MSRVRRAVEPAAGGAGAAAGAAGGPGSGVAAATACEGPIPDPGREARPGAAGLAAAPGRSGDAAARALPGVGQGGPVSESGAGTGAASHGRAAAVLAAARPAAPWRLGAGFLLPFALVVAVFFLIPAVLTVILSLTDVSVATGLRDFRWVGLENYRRILTDPVAGLVLRNTLLYVGATLTLFNVGLALVLALATAFLPQRWGGFFRAVWLLPRITPSVVYVLMWKYFAAEPPYGVINQVLAALGLPAGGNWLYEHPWPMVIAINGFVGASMGMIIFSAAIQAIPREQLIAAQVDGAGTWALVRRVVLPQLRWPALFVAAYQTLSLLASYEYILLATDGGPGFYTTEVWALYAFHTALSNYFGNAQYGLGAALATVLVVIGLVASVLYLRFFNFRQLTQRPRIEVS
ncbi:MAG: sugar ABC transporter permease [Bacillota bacterium]